MCSRYTLTSEAKELSNYFGVEVPPLYEKSYNAAPAKLLPVITSNDSDNFSFFYWGITPEWSKNKSVSIKLYNVHEEDIKNKASLQKALNSRRCLIPIDGYYEWKRISKKGRAPYRFVFNNNQLHAMAGLWEAFESAKNETIYTFTVITTIANTVVGKIHDRMPVIMNKKEQQLWLNQDSETNDLLNILKPLNDIELRPYAVSPKVNEVTNNSSHLIDPAPPADQFGNYSLFD